MLFFLPAVSTAAETILPPVKLGNIRREPVAAIWLDDKHAAIACAKSGSLIVWDVEKGAIQHEFAVGKQLRGVVRCSDDLLLIDDKSHELIRARYEGNQLTVSERYNVPAYPAGIVAFRDLGNDCVAVTSLWSRQVSLWSRGVPGLDSPKQSFSHVQSFALPFEPRLIAAIPQGVTPPGPHKTLLKVAEAFGGQIATIDVRTEKVATLSTNAHNIAGLNAADGRGLRYSHQQLEETVPTTLEMLTSGKLIHNQHSVDFTGLVRNRWRVAADADLERVRQARPDLFPDVATISSNADPAGFVTSGGREYYALAGLNEVVCFAPKPGPPGEVPGMEPHRIPVGARPRTVVAHDSKLLVLGELDDSVSLIKTNVFPPTVETRPLDPASITRTLSPAERGERLFFSAKNSAGQRMSCHSCHTDGHTNGLLADTLGDNTHGTPKRILTLRGTKLTDLWAWNGEMKTLQDNVHKSLRETMHAEKIAPADIDDLVSFLHTLPPVPPLKPKPADEADAKQVTRGEKIFLREACDRCHIPPLTYTSHDVYDVGMPDEQGLKKFNPPSLRGVGRLRRLFHDNRATSLTDVFETHGHQLTNPLPATELKDLVRFLESL